jgi:membrane protein required for beta-lactamase induction
MPAPNPVTGYAHTRQVWLQVLIPVAVCALAVIALAVSVSLSGNTQVTRFSDISIILLVLPGLLVGLVVIGIFGLGIFLQARFLRILPSYTALAQMYFDRLSQLVTRLSDRSASPILFFSSKAAGFKAIFRRRAA